MTATETATLGAPDRQESMTVAAARMLKDGSTCFVGIGLPGVAANLARITHAPGIVLVYESGVIGAKPGELPLSIGDDQLAETAELIVSLPEIFNYWLQAGRIHTGFLTTAQIDRFANLNTTVIGGDYDSPRTRLPGAGGAPEIASGCTEVIVTLRHSRRAFVERLDFVTTLGHGSGPSDRARHGLTTQGPRVVVTDLGILEPDPDTAELTLTGIHEGVGVDEVLAATGWPLRVHPELRVVPGPTPEELRALAELRSGGSGA
ncbi:MAG: CoA-transferase [Nocardioides sp.]